MEAQLLRDMIADRDRRITMVKQKTKDLDAKEQRLLDELDQSVELSAREQITYQTEKTRMLGTKQQALENLGQVRENLAQQGSSLVTYANMVVGSEISDHIDQNQVMRMQAQLCKAMHSMGILDHELKLVKSQHEALMKLQKDVLTQQREAKSQLELQLLNDMMKADGERKDVESNLRTELEKVQKQVRKMQREVEDDESESGDEKGSDSDEESNKEPDDEEKELQQAKEEMMKLLEQRKEQIKEIESKLDEQDAILAKMKEEQGSLKDESGQEIQVQTRPAKEEDQEDSEPEEDSEDEEDAAAAESARMDERLKQVMQNASMADVEKEDVDELDLLKLAQSRLAGGANNEDNDSEESDDDDSDEESEDEDYSDEDLDSSTKEEVPGEEKKSGDSLGTDEAGEADLVED